MDKGIQKMIIEKPDERSGVYFIINIVTKKVYVGETIDFHRRFCEHIRSIVGIYESNSNKNLVNEECKTFWIFAGLFNIYCKEKIKDINEWILDESIYMYLFRKYGFQLYNGDDNHQDNIGKNREFLMDNKVCAEELEKKFLLFLEKATPEYAGYDNWKTYIIDAEKELNKDIEKRFGRNSLKELAKLEQRERIVLWNKILKSKENSKDIIDTQNINIQKVNKICCELCSIKLKKEDMKKCGLEQIELRTLFMEKKLDRVIFSKFGHYLDQSPMTILTTKAYDIKNNKLCSSETMEISPRDEKTGDGICFWALKKLNVKYVQEFLSNNNEYKGPRYAILPYTVSKKYAFTESSSHILNLMDEENIEEFFKRMNSYYGEPIADEKFVYGYAKEWKYIVNKRTRNILPYPNTMFPEVVSKISPKGYNSNNVALLFSKLYYAKETFKNEDWFKLFWSYPRGEQNELSNSLCGSNSHICAGLKAESSIDDFDMIIDEDKVTGCLVAELKYPYIVALSNYDLDAEK